MKKILITGSNGYIARNLFVSLNNCDITLTNRQNLNLLNSQEVNDYFKVNSFDIVLHTAVSGGSRLQEDDYSWVYQNLLMVNNLMYNSHKFSKLISFGSGAELDRRFDINENSELQTSFPIDPYGLSKNSIAKSFINHEKFYNIRIFNVFNEDELETRMIKSNILKYMDKKPMKIFQNKIMDFFHMNDLVKIIDYYIQNEKCPHTINCTYESKYSLLDVANIINTLSNHKVEINIESATMGNSYYGKFDLNQLPIVLSSLQTSIEEMFCKLNIKT